ncbi:acetyltransferase (GNAT) family protein [Asanoa ferruginea]|uniref:Acetyltransferase (GNAT) family protein n=1 Tax=Asanoa ferruginea TaxID=53367 RepID=A0A3D9ZMP8_9ACTN|nr:acetyltransferase (GNAT) family protein [Asanoa ferruginea]GIF51958.1 N-acetyltransferase [Asanoa ferruginea]
MSVEHLEIRQLPFTAPESVSLVTDLLADLGARYNSSGDDTPVDASEFDPPNGAFLVAFLDGEPVGCAGWRSHGTDGEEAELKRMYTAPAGRRKGVARAVLRAVEDSAREAGRKRLILECGVKQPEAIAFYTANGYERIPDFGYYKGYPDVRSFGRTL